MKSCGSAGRRVCRHEDMAIFHRLMANGTQLDDTFAFLSSFSADYLKRRDETAQLSNSPR